MTNTGTFALKFLTDIHKKNGFFKFKPGPDFLILIIYNPLKNFSSSLFCGGFTLTITAIFFILTLFLIMDRAELIHLENVKLLLKGMNQFQEPLKLN